MCNDSPLYKFIKIEVIKEKKIIKQASIPLIFYLHFFCQDSLFFYFIKDQAWPLPSTHAVIWIVMCTWQFFQYFSLYFLDPLKHKFINLVI